jgi:hypothetical protein
LLEALDGGGGPGLVGKQEILLRAAVAALLNTTSGIDDGVKTYPARQPQQPGLSALSTSSSRYA